MSPRLSRRTILQGLGAGAALLPFLGRAPSAHAETPRKRLVIFFSSNGMINRNVMVPPGDGNAFALSSLPQLLSPLEPYTARLTIVTGIDNLAYPKDPIFQGHATVGHMLTGRINHPLGPDNGSNGTPFWASGISVDQHIANRLGVEALTLAARPSNVSGMTRISYRGQDQPEHPIEDPLAAFHALFSDFTQPPEQVDARKRQQRLVLDAVAGNMSSLRKKLPAADADKLDEHLTLISELQAKLEQDAVLSCAQNDVDALAQSLGVAPFEYKKNEHYPECGRRQMDVCVRALACGLTDVCTIQLGFTTGSILYPGQWLSDAIDTPYDEHDIAHNISFADPNNPQSLADSEALADFYFRQYKYLLDGLDSVEEANGTLLDNTVVVWVKSLAADHASNGHSYILAGGKDMVNQGRYRHYDGVPHNNLLLSLCHMMGLGDETSFGDPELCTGVLSDLLAS